MSTLGMPEDSVAGARLRIRPGAHSLDGVHDVIRLGLRDEIELRTGCAESDVVRRDDDPAEGE